jgi:hypothetical protein
MESIKDSDLVAYEIEDPIDVKKTGQEITFAGERDFSSHGQENILGLQPQRSQERKR